MRNLIGTQNHRHTHVSVYTKKPIKRLFAPPDCLAIYLTIEMRLLKVEDRPKLSWVYLVFIRFR